MSRTLTASIFFQFAASSSVVFAMDVVQETMDLVLAKVQELGAQPLALPILVGTAMMLLTVVVLSVLSLSKKSPKNGRKGNSPATGTRLVEGVRRSTRQAWNGCPLQSRPLLTASS